MPTKAMLVVSHNIEEAVLMADRVLIFAQRPRPHPLPARRATCRARAIADSADVRPLIDEVYALMTAGAPRAGRPAEEPEALQPARPPAGGRRRAHGRPARAACRRHLRRPRRPATLAEETELTDDELLPLAQALSLLGLASSPRATCSSRRSAGATSRATNASRQQLFGEQLLAHVPLAAHIRHSLEQEPSGELAEEPFLRLLSESLDAAEAERVLRTVIEWGRHGEVFEYDYNTGLIRVPRSEAAAEAAA